MPVGRRDPYSTYVVKLPERDLAASLLDLAAPLLEALGPSPPLESARSAVELAVTFWNASINASIYWGDRRPKALNELRRKMRGRQSAPADAAIFDALSANWNERFAFDPRLVRRWTYEADARGERRLVCEMGLPERVRADVPPPIEKRVRINGRFLDEVGIRSGPNSTVIFPVEHHRAVLGDDGSVTVYAKMPSALQLFAEGVLPHLGRGPVDLLVRGVARGPMILARLERVDEYRLNELAVLHFVPM